MKIRQGFVSNSSSSSFVIVANEVDFNELSTLGYQLAKEMTLFACHEDDWNDGYDFFPVSQLMLANYLKWSYLAHPLNFYNVYKILNDDYIDKIKIKKADIPEEGAHIYSMEVSQHSTLDLNGFLSRHISSLEEKDVVIKVPKYSPPKKKNNPIEEIHRADLIDLD